MKIQPSKKSAELNTKSAAFDFLRLPYELRQLIYGHCFAKACITLNVWNLSSKLVLTKKCLFVRKNMASILLTCKLCFNEGRSILFDYLQILMIDVPHCNYNNMLNQISRYTRRHIKHLSIRCSVDDIVRISKEFPYQMFPKVKEISFGHHEASFPGREGMTYPNSLVDRDTAHKHSILHFLMGYTAHGGFDLLRIKPVRKRTMEIFISVDLKANTLENYCSECHGDTVISHHALLSKGKVFRCLKGEKTREEAKAILFDENLDEPSRTFGPFLCLLPAEHAHLDGNEDDESDSEDDFVWACLEVDFLMLG